jgi:hypothetical protein
MNRLTKFAKSLVALILLTTLAACASTGAQRNAMPTELLQKPVEEVSEAQLLDVNIRLFDPGALPEGDNKSRGLSMEIREAEARYMPIHLRTVMEKTGYWGAVRVVPIASEGYELLVEGTIIGSDGELVLVKIEALDASGRRWFSRSYGSTVTVEDYQNLNSNDDVFNPVYHLIANDLAKFRATLSDQQRKEIRRIASMRFAADMAPDAFAGHIRKNATNEYQLLRLPAEDDPAYQRVQALRERDFLLIDTLNGHYDNFYVDMTVPYEEWRKARSIEQEALREVKRQANTSKVLGAAAILGAIAIEVLGGPETRASTGTLRDVMVLGGFYGIKRGMDINAQSTLHEEEISELGDSFSAEAEPMVVEVDGEIHKLSGSAETQYAQWRKLTRKIYLSETGLDPEPESSLKTQGVDMNPVPGAESKTDAKKTAIP